MTGQCDSYPVRFVRSRGKVQFRYNIIDDAVPLDDGGMKTIYRYEYAEAYEPTRESVLEAMSGVEGAEAILDEAGEIVVREEPSIT